MILLSREDVLSISKGQVTSPELFNRDGIPNINGVLSEEIFGSTPMDKSKNFGHIDLNCKAMTPVVFDLFKKAFRKEYKIAYSMEPYIFKSGEIEQLKPDEISKHKNVLYGMSGILDNLQILKNNTDTASDDTGKMKKEFWAIVDKYGESRILIDILPVIPVSLRPYSNMFRYDELNTLYSNFIKGTTMIMSINKMNVYKYALSLNYIHKYLTDIYDNIKLKTAKEKSSHVRKNVLAKRVDFSGRSVATVNPDIPPTHIGLPFQMAVKIFEPWIIRRATVELSMSVEECFYILNKISKHAKIDKDIYEKILSITKDVTKDRSVIVKRDPNLHRGSAKPFGVIIVEDKSIQVNNIVNETFNLDYDGDQLAVFTPITNESLEDIEKMKNILHSADPRKMMINFTHDIKGGICILMSSPKSAKVADTKNYYWWKKTKFNGVQTTEGRVMMYNLASDSIKKILDFNKYFNVDNFSMENVVYELLSNDIPQKEVIDFSDKVQKLASKIITIASESIDIEDLKISEVSLKYRNMLKKETDNIKRKKIIEAMQNALNEHLKDSSIGLLISCGIIKKAQLFQLLGSKGIVLKPDGSLEVIDSNFSNGLSPKEYFHASYGSRNGIVFRTSKTAITGYLERKMVYGLMSVEVDENNSYCGTTKLLKITPDDYMIKRIINRNIIFNGKEYKITLKNYKDFIGKEIEMYSPIYCKSKKVCTKCAGDDYKLLNSPHIGMIAAQTIGERLTQNMLKAFHTGGIVEPYILDFYKNVSENTKIKPSELSSIFLDSKNTFIANDEISMHFSKDYYNLKLLVSGSDSQMPLTFFLSYADINSKKIDIVYDGSIVLYASDDYETTKDEYILKYKKGSKIFSLVEMTDDMEIISKKILNTVEGRISVMDEYHLLMKIYRFMKEMGDINLLWEEILVSQLLRDKSNNKIPARLGKTWNPEIVSIKQIPYLESWTRGLMFENFGKSVNNALLNPEKEIESELEVLI